MTDLTAKCRRLIELGEKVADEQPWYVQSSELCCQVIADGIIYNVAREHGELIAESRNSGVDIAKDYLELHGEAEILRQNRNAHIIHLMQFEKQNQKLREALDLVINVLEDPDGDIDDIRQFTNEIYEAALKECE